MKAKEVENVKTEESHEGMPLRCSILEIILSSGDTKRINNLGKVLETFGFQVKDFIEVG